ncbi:MAG TPA: preQ(1) synthase [Rhizomicrobium sp.]
MSTKKAKSPTSKLTQLGHLVAAPQSPETATLESVPNPQRDCDYVVRFTAPEFTCLCPVTGQPDFAHFVIDYCPAARLIESKSLKLFLGSFRSHAAFHEDTTLLIGKRVLAAIKPKFLRIAGYWYPRGGMPIDVFWQTGKLPRGVWLPETGVLPYRGRG